MESSLLIAGLIFVLVLLIGFLAFYYSDQHRKKRSISQRITKEASPENDAIAPGRCKWNIFLVNAVSRVGESLRPKKEENVSLIRKRLMRAGYYGEKGPIVFFGLKVCAAIVLSVISAVIKFTVLLTMPAGLFLMFIIVSAAAGFYLPDLYLYRRTLERKRKIFEAFPDALDLMVVCVEAGMGLDAAIKRVGHEMTRKSKPLSDEFKMLSLELRAGKPRPEALRNLAMRTDLEDIASLTTLLIQTDKFGTKIAQALRVHSDAMRTKRYLRAEEIAAKLPVKIVVPLIFFIFPSLFVTIIGPAVIKIYRVFILR
jgi:tight adherence protein C